MRPCCGLVVAVVVVVLAVGVTVVGAIVVGAVGMMGAVVVCGR